MKKTASNSNEKDRGIHDSAHVDDPNEEGLRRNKDPETLAKEITDPLIQSIREELSKIDLTKFKK